MGLLRNRRLPTTRRLTRPVPAKDPGVRPSLAWSANGITAIHKPEDQIVASSILENPHTCIAGWVASTVREELAQGKRRATKTEENAKPA